MSNKNPYKEIQSSKPERLSVTVQHKGFTFRFQEPDSATDVESISMTDPSRDQKEADGLNVEYNILAESKKIKSADIFQMKLIQLCSVDEVSLSEIAFLRISDFSGAGYRKISAAVNRLLGLVDTTQMMAEALAKNSTGDDPPSPNS